MDDDSPRPSGENRPPDRAQARRTSRKQPAQSSGPHPGNDGSPISDQAFPIMVGDVSGGLPSGLGGRGRGGGSAGGGAQLVESALRDVLGWRPRAADPKGFVAALSQSFTCTEVAGHTECRWTPRSYAASIQADLGALTGAQASIYEQAKLLVGAALPILDRLRPLLPDPDQENVSARRAIVRSRLEEIPKELGTEGGPRVQRADELFDALLGVGRPMNGGELAELGRQLGMDRNRINTLDEEVNFTDFLMLERHVKTLDKAWQADRLDFQRSSNGDPNSQPFLGTQLVLLSRQLEVVAETVGETYFAMDTVFLGAAERQTLLLDLDGRSRLTIAELLDWVERFATEEGPRLITDGGLAGVRSAAPTLKRLADLVEAAIEQNCVPPSYQTARVRQALTQLQQQLERAAKLAGALTPTDK